MCKYCRMDPDHQLYDPEYHAAYLRETGQIEAADKVLERMMSMGIEEQARHAANGQAANSEEKYAGSEQTSMPLLPPIPPAGGMDVPAFLRAQHKFIEALSMSNVGDDLQFTAASKADYIKALENVLWDTGDQRALIAIQGKYIELLSERMRHLGVL